MLGGGLARGLIKKAAAAGVVAGAGLVAVACLGATVFFALSIVVIPLAAAAITFAVFAVVAAFVAIAYFVKEDDPAEEEDPGVGQRAFALFRERPVLGTVAGLAAGWIFLRNPALATMVAAAFTERRHPHRRRY